MESIKKFLSTLGRRPRSVAVIGDGMVDEYYYVTADRVSPEFPIPVLLSQTNKPHHLVPGGAANVARQLNGFHCDVEFFGFVDSSLASTLNKYGINIGGSMSLSINGDIGSVPVKKRIYDNGFPLCRWDIEENNYGQSLESLKNLQDCMYKKFDSWHTPFDVVVFSDYGKGVFKGCAEKWCGRSMNPITIVDPKGGPISMWKGCSIIKPNSKEAEAITGTRDWRKQCAEFYKATECTSVVITQGGTGVVGSVMGREFEYRPEREVDASSVIGAGDCFVAVLAVCMSYQMDLLDAVEVAFEAGSVYVQRSHNEPVEIQELADITGFDKPLPKAHRNYKLVFTGGCFDIFHSGHAACLEFAKSKGDRLIVGLNSDEYLSKKHPGRPICTFEHRKKVLESLACVDFVIEFNEDTPYNLIKGIQPDVIVKGADWEGNIVGSDLVSEIYTFPLVEGMSTSTLIEKIKSE